MGLNIRLYFQNPQKEPRLVTYFAWGIGCGREEEPIKTNILGVIYFTHTGRQTPGRICTKFCIGRYPGRNHCCKFWGRSVKGF